MNKVVFLSVLITCLVVGTLLGLFFVSSGVKPAEVKKALGIEEKEYYSKPLDVVTNMGMGTYNQRFLKSKIVISTMDKKLHKKMEEGYTIKIQDSLVRYMNSQPPINLTDPNNRGNIKKDIIRTLEEDLKIKVEGVYFVDFVVQQD